MRKDWVTYGRFDEEKNDAAGTIFVCSMQNCGKWTANLSGIADFLYCFKNTMKACNCVYIPKKYRVYIPPEFLLHACNINQYTLRYLRNYQ